MGVEGFSKWNSTWTEGCCYEQDKHGYGNSTLTLELKSGYNLVAGTLTEVWVAYENNIQAQCSMRANDEARTITIIPNRTNENDWLFPASFSFGYEDGLDDDRVNLVFDGRFSHDAQIKRGVNHHPSRKATPSAQAAATSTSAQATASVTTAWRSAPATTTTAHRARRVQASCSVRVTVRSAHAHSDATGEHAHGHARTAQRCRRSDGALFSYDLEDDAFARFQKLHPVR